MNNNLKYALMAGIFLLCVGIGFLVTRIGKDNVKETADNMPNKEVSGMAPSSSGVETDSIIEPGAKGHVDEQAPIKIVSKEVKKVGNFYTLRVVCINIPKDVTISYEIPALKKKSIDGIFSKIPGCKSGSYLLNVINVKNNDILLSEEVSGFLLIEDAKVEKMSASQFQALLLNQNDNSLLGGKNPKIARNITLSFTGLQDGEKRPSDILAIREKIAFGIWSSARVLQVGYDDNGRINSARIQPVY